MHARTMLTTLTATKRHDIARTIAAKVILDSGIDVLERLTMILDNASINPLISNINPENIASRKSLVVLIFIASSDESGLLGCLLHDIIVYPSDITKPSKEIAKMT